MSWFATLTHCPARSWPSTLEGEISTKSSFHSRLGVVGVGREEEGGGSGGARFRISIDALMEDGVLRRMRQMWFVPPRKSQ